MSPLTRAVALFSSSESRLFIRPNRRYSTAARSVAVVSFLSTTRIKLAHRQLSSTSNEKRTSFTSSSGHRGPDPSMGGDASFQAEFDAPSVVEDFVSIDGPSLLVGESPSIDVESLVQSVSSVDEDRGDEATADVGVGGDERKVLTEELSRSVITLSCESSAEGGICDVYLVGTAHVSQESCKQVEAVISFLKPQAVFLELCSSRVAILTMRNLKVPTMGEMVDMWKKNDNNLFGILYSWFLAKIASNLEVLPGGEFRVAFEEAVKYGGRVILGDRPVHITLRRTWAKMPLWHKMKLLCSLVFQSFFLPSAEDFNKMLKELDDIDMLTLVIQEMSKNFPTLMETLVHERDQYMSSTLIKVAREHSIVVAVVGKGHLQGIKKHWKQPVELQNLLVVDIPLQKLAISVGKILTTAGVAVAGVAIISCIYLSIKK